MKQCPNCGSQFDDSIKFCANCGTTLPDAPIPNPAPAPAPYPNAEPAETYNYNPASMPQFNPNAPEDKANVGLCILAFLIPLFGWIYWGVKSKETPKKAKACGMTASISCALGIIFSVIMSIGGASCANKIKDKVEESSTSYYGEEETTLSFWDETTTDVEDETTTETDTSNQTTTSSNVSVGKLDWNKVVVNVNGANITFPCSYSDFVKKTGLELYDKQDAEQTLKANNYTTVSMRLSENSQYIYIGVLNETSDVKKVPECTVYGISDDELWSDYTDIPMVFPWELKVGDKYTVDELKKKCGKPDYQYDSDDSDYHTLTYRAGEYTTYQKIEVTIKDGKIHAIDLYNYPQD